MRDFFMFNRLEIPIKVTRMLLSLVKVNVTFHTLEKDLQNHPDYPALLSIGDVLQGYGVDNITFVSSIDKLDEIPPPFIAQVKSQYTFEDLFVLIRSVKEGFVHYYEPEINRWKFIDRIGFRKMWQSGIVLIMDASEAQGEPDYQQRRLEEWQANFVKYFNRLLLPVLAIIAGLWRFTAGAAENILPLLFFILTLSGSIISVLLIWYELDEYNPLLQKICSAGRKTNCSAILNSKASKIIGISWATIGSTYFVGGLFLMLFSGLTYHQCFWALAWMNILACPYVLFSIYYQWQVARQWCILCLSIQALLILQLLVASLAEWHSMKTFISFFSPEILIPLATSYALPFCIISILVPMFQVAKENKQNKAELQRMKHDPQIFESLLKKQKAYPEGINGLGITIGNANAIHKIVKVCNPYCNPCSKSHLTLTKLLHGNPDVQLQVIFFTTDNEKDPQRFPVKHLLAIAEQKDETLIEKAMDDWYRQEIRDYDSFARKYPVSDAFKDNEDKLKAMSDWISKADVHATPTIFLDGYKLPATYDVNDLKYILSM